MKIATARMFLRRRTVAAAIVGLTALAAGPALAGSEAYLPSPVKGAHAPGSQGFAAFRNLVPKGPGGSVATPVLPKFANFVTASTTDSGVAGSAPGNSSTIVQHGVGNSATVAEFGAGNASAVTQLGRSNIAVVTQVAATR